MLALTPANAPSMPKESMLIWIGALVVLLVWHLLRTRELRRNLGVKAQELEAAEARISEMEGSLTNLSLTDPLTGLPNRRYVQVSLPMDAAQTLRGYRDLMLGSTTVPPTNGDLVLLKVGVDQFKQLTLDHGFAASDHVLKELKGVLQRSSRGSDAVIRFEQDSFLVVAREASRQEARVLAERILAAVAKHEFAVEEGKVLRCTCSLGAAAFPLVPTLPKAATWEKVLELAEACHDTAQRTQPGSWLMVTPTEAFPQEGAVAELPENLPDLVAAGQMDAQSNLERHRLVWK